MLKTIYELIYSYKLENSLNLNFSSFVDNLILQQNIFRYTAIAKTIAKTTAKTIAKATAKTTAKAPAIHFISFYFRDITLDKMYAKEDYMKIEVYFHTKKISF